MKAWRWLLGCTMLGIAIPGGAELLLVKADGSEYLGWEKSASSFGTCDGTVLAIEEADELVATDELCPREDDNGPGPEVQEEEPPPG